MRSLRTIVTALLLVAAGFSAGWLVRGPVVKPSANSKMATTESTLSQVDSIMRSGGNEVEMPFPEVIRVASGHQLVPMMADELAHREAMEAIAEALDATLAEMNAKDSPIKGLRRINEASAYFEDSLHRRLEAHPAFTCDIPHTAAGKVQRSGYPDLRILHKASGKVIYLDPKLYEEASRSSTLRTFYFTSDPSTLKVGEDAAHWLAGIRHDGADGEWKFTGWDLVDLARLKVKLKAEFQAANRDLYSESMLLRSSAPTRP